MLDRRSLIRSGCILSVSSCLTGCLRLTEESANQSTDTPTADAGERETTSDDPDQTATPSDGDPTTTEEAATTEAATTEEATTEGDGDVDPEFTTVTGEITAAAGIELDGTQVELFSFSLGRAYKLSLRDGTYAESVPAGESYLITYFHEDGEYISDFDGVPVLYALEDEIEIDGEELTLDYELPQAYRTEIRIVDADSDPIPDFPVNFRAPNGSGIGPGNFTTDADGYAKFVDNSETGVDLAGEVTVEADIENGGGDRLRDITVTEPNEFTVIVQNPDQYV
jgi:hypothetical protein